MQCSMRLDALVIVSFRFSWSTLFSIIIGVLFSTFAWSVHTLACMLHQKYGEIAFKLTPRQVIAQNLK